MTYWLQELQQKRWEYCNSLDLVKWDSRTSPTPGEFSKGLVARDNTGRSDAEGNCVTACVSTFDIASQLSREILVMIPFE